MGKWLQCEDAMINDDTVYVHQIYFNKLDMRDRA